MSFGTSMRFEVKDGGKGGIFWQKEKPAQKPRKFGYKSKELRHPIRRPESEMEEEPKVKVKPSKDFIKRNRDQYRKPGAHDDEDNKENHRGRGSSGATTAGLGGRPSSSIKPGMVTLTQEQLNALLATVGKLKPGEAGNVRISIDTENNALQLESPRDNMESAPNSSHLEAGDRKAGRQDDISIFSLAKDGNADDPKNSGSSGYGSEERSGGGKEVRFDTARNEERQKTPETTPAPPPLVPWRHMTVAERKRLQWAREKEAEEQLQKQGKNAPWGRPGDRAPQRQPEPDPQLKTASQEELTQNEKLRKAIDAIEAKFGDLLNPPGDKEPEVGKKSTTAARGREQQQQEKGQRKKDGGEGTADDILVIPGLDNSYAIPVSGEDKSGTSRQLEDRGNSRPPRRPDRRDPRREREGERKEKRKTRERRREEEEGEAGRGRGAVRKEGGGGEDRGKRDQEPGGSDLPSAPAAAPAAMQTSLFIGQPEPDTTQFLSKKELEKKKWLEELDRQREEKRLEKQREKEKAREGLDDTWADRFAAPGPASQPAPPPPNQPPSQLSHHQQQQQQQQMPYGVAWERPAVQSWTSNAAESDAMPPAAMRSAMIIGNVAPNTDRIQQRQAEEKRLWLEELNKQREEQREARLRLKERQRAPSPPAPEHTWASRFSQDPRPTAGATEAAPQRGPAVHGEISGGALPPPPQDLSSSVGRIGSAPQPPHNELLEEESKTFLRGQNVHMDPVTRRELEEKRRKHLEYQTAIKTQIEEKERKKREEREQKWKEEMEGERKLQAERDALQRQLEAENSKNRQREEARQRQVEQLKNLMDAEQERAQGERMMKRLTTLQQAGHDVTGLKAHYHRVPHDNGMPLAAHSGQRGVLHSLAVLHFFL